MPQSYITNPPKWCDNVAEVNKFGHPASPRLMYPMLVLGLQLSRLFEASTV